MSFEEFKNKVRTMVKIDDDISQGNAMLKELRTRKTQLQQEIMQYMTEQNITTCNVEDGKLSLSTSKTMAQVKKEDIARAFSESLGCDVGRAEQVIETLYDNRRVTERTVLRRTRKRTRRVEESVGDHEDYDEEEDEV